MTTILAGLCLAACLATAGSAVPFRVVPVHPLVKVARDGSNLPDEQPPDLSLRVCRGARRSVQIAVVAEDEDLRELRVVRTEDRYPTRDAEAFADVVKARVYDLSVRPLRYVPAKHPQDPGRMAGNWPDCLDTGVPEQRVYLSVPQGEVQPFWITVDADRDAKSGVYLEEIVVEYRHPVAPQQAFLIQHVEPLRVEVLDITLPEPHDFRFLLGIWQNQGSIARRYGLESWSDEHWEMLKVYTADLARYGQDYITVGRHLFDWTKTADGWEFGYDLFDRYVNMCMDQGITRGIEYLQLFNGRRDQEVHYRDVVAGKDVSYRCNVADPEWDDPYLAFLTDFARHLREKGWFDRTWVCPTDEPQDVYTGRALSDFAHATEVLRQADSEFKTTVAIDNFKSAQTLEPYIDRYVFKLRQDVYDHDFAQERLAEGKRVEWYICCHPERPNTFITGDLTETVAIGWMTYRENLEGLLRWSYTARPTDPFGKPEGDGKYTAGDLFIVYPGENGPLASVRWEALLEGIQDFELLHMLSDEIAAAREAGLEEEATLAATGMERAVRLVAGESQTLLDYTTNPGDIDRARPAENSVPVWALAVKQTVLRMARVRDQGCRPITACPLLLGALGAVHGE